MGGVDVPELGRGPVVGRARLRVRRLGTPGARRRRQPRIAARVGLARRARHLRRRAAEPRAGAVGDSRRCAARARALRARGAAAPGTCLRARRAQASLYPRVMRRLTVWIVCGLGFALPASAQAAAGSLGSAPKPALAGPSAPTGAAPSPPSSTSSSSSSSTTATDPNAPIPVPASNAPPAGRRMSANQVLAIAERLPKVRSARRRHAGSYGGAYLKPAFHWQVSYFSKNGKTELAQVIIDDASGRVL